MWYTIEILGESQSEDETADAKVIQVSFLLVVGMIKGSKNSFDLLNYLNHLLPGARKIIIK